MQEQQIVFFTIGLLVGLLIGTAIEYYRIRKLCRKLKNLHMEERW